MNLNLILKAIMDLCDCSNMHITFIYYFRGWQNSYELREFSDYLNPDYLVIVALTYNDNAFMI